MFGSNALATELNNNDAETVETMLSAVADSNTHEVGDTMTVTGNTGFAALQFDVTYDVAVIMMHRSPSVDNSFEHSGENKPISVSTDIKSVLTGCISHLSICLPTYSMI